MANIRESLTVRMGPDEQTRCKMSADSAWHPSRLATVSLKRRMPFLRSSVWRLGMGLPRFIKTGQFGDGREEACAAYVKPMRDAAMSTTCWPPSTSSPPGRCC
jgi:hypothetical protein